MPDVPEEVEVPPGIEIHQVAELGEGQHLELVGSVDLFRLSHKQREVVLKLLDTFSLLGRSRSRPVFTETKTESVEDEG